MKFCRRQATIGAFSAAAGIASSKARGFEWDGPIFRALEGLDEFWLATDAYIFGYPLVTVEMTRRVMTNVLKADVP